MKPPPPRLPAAGCVTASANATAIAASIALPPRFMMSTPTREATSLVEATIPCDARTGSRDAACAAGVVTQNGGNDENPAIRMAMTDKRNGRKRRLFVRFICFTDLKLSKSKSSVREDRQRIQ